jgi:hypothetical protein
MGIMASYFRLADKGCRRGNRCLFWAAAPNRKLVFMAQKGVTHYAALFCLARG